MEEVVHKPRTGQSPLIVGDGVDSEPDRLLSLIWDKEKQEGWSGRRAAIGRLVAWAHGEVYEAIRKHLGRIHADPSSADAIEKLRSQAKRASDELQKVLGELRKGPLGSTDREVVATLEWALREFEAARDWEAVDESDRKVLLNPKGKTAERIRVLNELKGSPLTPGIIRDLWEVIGVGIIYDTDELRGEFFEVILDHLESVPELRAELAQPIPEEPSDAEEENRHNRKRWVFTSIMIYVLENIKDINIRYYNRLRFASLAAKAAFIPLVRQYLEDELGQSEFETEIRDTLLAAMELRGRAEEGLTRTSISTDVDYVPGAEQSTKQSSDKAYIEKEFFSQGPDRAQDRIVDLAAAFIGRYPGHSGSLRRRFLQTIGEGLPSHPVTPQAESPGNRKTKSPDSTKSSRKPRREPKIDLPRLGRPLAESHPLIESLAQLWDKWKSLPRREFVQSFQSLLDQYHDIKSLGDYGLNRIATAWVNQITVKGRMKLMLDGERAVTIECARRGSGYFIPRTAEKAPQGIPGSNSYNFPKLTALSL